LDKREIEGLLCTQAATGLEFVVGEGEVKTLVMHDAQHEYVFDTV
jgi:hypothetical protein